MPRKLLPPRLQLRTRKGRDPVYVIRDGDYERSTGFGPERRRDAEAALSAYISEKHAAPSGTFTPDQMAIGTVLTIYASEHAPTLRSPERVGYSIQALAPFWGDLPVSAITKNTCRRYAKERMKENGEPVSDGTIIKELSTLRAALNYCREEGRLTVAPPVWTPEKPAAKERWLTRSEVARLIRAARRAGNHHLARFILIGIYTGSRKGVILSLQYMPNFTGGHVDLGNGLLFRKAVSETETKKRKPNIRIPRRLLLHMQNWRAQSRQYVIEWNGEPVKDIKKSFAAACEAAGIEDATPHTLRHTAITWAMQGGARTADVISFYGVSQQTLEDTYWHHHPDYQESVHAAYEPRFRG